MMLSSNPNVSEGARRPSLLSRVLASMVVFMSVWFFYPMTTAHAEGPPADKSGVSPQVISLPSGPGSIEGIGESFEPDLSTGTASYPVKLEVPPGRAGVVPQLGLSYNGGHGNSPWGLGWRLGVPFVQRQTDEGLPSYEPDGDRFIYSNGEKLVALSGGDYRFSNEGEFMRFRRLDDDGGDGGWEAHLPNGTRYLFGESDAARETNEYGIFRWRLERQVDTHGNEVRYFYTHDGGYAYLSEVRYNESRDGRYNAVRFTYEERADSFTSRVSRAPITIARRASEVEMWALGQLVRRYQFAYAAESSTGTHSLLSSITQVGSDGVSELPATRFTYTEYDPTNYNVLSMENPPPVSLLDGDAELVDINADSLPDVVYTPAEGHRFYLNRGLGRWQETPEYPLQSPGDRLSSPNAQMVDVTGNGQVDFVVKTGQRFYYYAGEQEEEWEQDDRVDYNLAPSFQLDDPDVRWFDANHDKRVDLMFTTDNRYFIWFSHDDDSWSETADATIPALSVGTPLRFSDSRVKLADMTGDRLQDLAFVRDGLLSYWPSNGNGDYAEMVTMANAPAGLHQVESQLQLGDLNNDGLADLLLPSNGSVRYWLNRGDNSFSDEVLLTGTPHYNQNDTAVRLADIDGDGASELLYSRFPAPADEVMQYVDFFTGTQPHLLRTIDNGLGRTMRIEYQPSSAFYVADWNSDDRDMPWQTKLPFPVQVVSRLTVHDANSGDSYITDYDYRDGYYDGEQKEFRGFAQVDQIQHGDESAATTITRHVYDTGVVHESRKGLVLEKEVLGEGGTCADSALQSKCYQHEVSQPTTRILDEGTSGVVSYSFITQTDLFIYENEETPVQLRQTFDRDAYGNPTQEFNYGQICADDVTCGDDELLKSTDYALNLENWIVNKPKEQLQTDVAGNVVSHKRFYYDGEPYVGLPQGQLTRGDLMRQEDKLTGTTTTPDCSTAQNADHDEQACLTEERWLPTLRQAVDEHGNVIGMMNANGNLTTIEYDPLVQSFPVVERMHLDDHDINKDDDHNGKSLSMAVSYDVRFGKITAATDFNGNSQAYTYDAFGRISKIALPGDTLALPTQQFSYLMGSPRSMIVTAQRERVGEAEERVSVTYFDGLGRTLQSRREGENGQVVVENSLTFNARQGEQHKYLPYFDNTFDYAPPDPAQPHTRSHYDAMGRVRRVDNPDGSFSSVLYGPLAQVQYDEEDNTPDSAYFETPKTFFYDGLERIRGVEEVNKVNDQLESYNTTYNYDPLGNMTQITDAQGNLSTMHYDALSRKIYMHNPDRGQMFYQYDDVGNLLQTRDANGQVVQYRYDAVNRPLSEQWILSDTSSLPAVVYHYDNDRATDHPDAQHTLGKVTYIEDQAGATYMSYDARGNLTASIRHLAEENLDFVARMQYDAMDRVSQITYPDGMTVTQAYNAQGLLERIPGYIENVDYVASGQRAAISYQNGVRSQHNYDNRQRIRLLESHNAQSAALQALAYTFDHSNNIISISDNRADRNAFNDQSHTYAYDALYRLTNATGSYGQIDYAYDSIGNMTHKNSSTDDTRLNLGDLEYCREGSCGPHALTFADGQSYHYDANGNLTRKGDTTHTWDHRDRLTSVDDGDTHSSYLYDAGGQRVRQTVSNGDTLTTTLYIGQYAEVRDEQLVQYIFADNARIAQTSTPFDPNRLIQGFTDSQSPPQPAPERQTRWYLSDHLGGTSLLLDENGQLTSEIAYYPYGLTRYERNGAEVNYGFTGKEEDETGLHYFGARYYDAKTGVWLSTDPMLEGYLPTGDKKQDQNLPGMGGVFNTVNLNLYHYAGLNPLKYVDPDGNKIVLADSSSLQFQNDVEQSKKYLERADTSGIIKKLENSSEAVYIIEFNGNNHYYLPNYQNRRTILFNPRLGVANANGEIQSPALYLLHEMGHALQHLENPLQLQNDSVPDEKSLYSNREEERVITTIETPAARILGEPTRNSHGGTPVKVGCPTCRLPIVSQSPTVRGGR